MCRGGVVQPNVILTAIPQCTIVNIQNKLVEEWPRNSDFPPTNFVVYNKQITCAACVYDI